MNKSLAAVSKTLLLLGCISALCEYDWQISVALLMAGFGGLISSGIAQGSADNERYHAAVMAQKPIGGSTFETVPTTSPYAGFLALGMFLGVSFLTIHFDSLWPIGLAFVAACAIGIRWALKRATKRHKVWQEFCVRHKLKFIENNLWDPLQNATIVGESAGRNIRLEIVWQDSGSSSSGRRRSEVLIAEAITMISDPTFCVDDLRIQDSEPELVKLLFEQPELRERIEAAAPKRISLFEESLTFHFPRVPATQLELTFYLSLLVDTANSLERLRRTAS